MDGTSTCRPSWCIGVGHSQEVLPIPAKDGKCDLVPVIRGGVVSAPQIALRLDKVMLQ